MKIHSWEYKTLLKPGNFANFNSGVDKFFQTVISPVATANNAKCSGTVINTKPTTVKFYDVQSNGTWYFKDGSFLVRWRMGQQSDLTIKYRTPSEAQSSQGQVRSPEKTNMQKIKLKDEIVLPAELPGMRSLYSLDNEMPLDFLDPLPTDASGWTSIFPGLALTGVPASATVGVVNGIVIDQQQSDVCTLEFVGKDQGTIQATGDIALWSNGSTPLVAEFSYAFSAHGGLPPSDALDACNAFYQALQASTYLGWIFDRGTKTSVIYGS
jgi:hypothetical protein